jgi:hypothetical protein
MDALRPQETSEGRKQEGHPQGVPLRGGSLDHAHDRILAQRATVASHCHHISHGGTISSLGAFSGNATGSPTPLPGEEIKIRLRHNRSVADGDRSEA